MTAFNPEQQILHFRILRKIGEGGMGEVYLAQDLKLERRIAVKVLPWQIRTEEKARKRLLQEARSASALNHPNIVTIHSVEETADFDLIVMEYVEGETLSSLIYRDGPLEVTAISNFGQQIAEALFAAHSTGIIHRDIKSANIVISPRGKVKILDFGLAKLATHSEQVTDFDGRTPSATDAGTVLGTVSYMSPEQVKGESVDLRTDIFSLGCVLFEAATGRLPFLGPNLAAIMYQIATVEPVLPSSLRKDLPAQVDQIVLRALAKNREERYSNASEIANDLRQLSFLPTQRVTTLDPATQTVDASTTFYSDDTVVVGREIELRRLEETFLLTKNGQGKIVFIAGEAGIGKTSVVNTFLEKIRTRHRNLIITTGHCVEHYGTSEAYLPFLDAIGSLLNSGFKEQVISVLRNHAPTWFLQFPSHLGSVGSVAKLQEESRGVTRERMLREFCDAMSILSSTNPIVLVLEDLHWADTSTVDLLRYLCSRFSDSRLLLVATFRDKDVESKNHPLKSCLLELKTHNQSDQITLDTLLPGDIRTFLNRSYSPNQFAEELSPLIYRKTEGHPLFVTSLVQFLNEKQILKKQDEQWVLTRPSLELDLEVPENVRSMIRKKIEELTTEENELLQYASIGGVEFLSNILADLLVKEEIAIEEKLNSISRMHGMIRQTGEEELPDGSLAMRYRFSHVLYQNVLYEDIIKKRRILLHRQTAEVLLSHYGSHASRIASQLALHFRLGRDHARAFEYFTVAGDNAEKLFANFEATTLYRNALQQLEEHCNRYPDERARWDAPMAEVHEKLGDVLALSGMQKEARDEYEKAELKLSSTDRLRKGRIHRKIAKAWETERFMEQAIKEYELAEILLSDNLENAEPEQWNEWIELHLARVWLHYTRNELEALETLSERMRPAVERYGTPVQRSRHFQSYLNLSYRRHRYGIHDETLHYATEALQAAQDSKDLRQIAVMNFAYGFCRLWRGEFELAHKHLQEGLLQAEKIGDAVLQSRCISYLTVAHRKMENLEKVREYIPKCFEICSAFKMDEYVAAAHANQAWLGLREQKPQETRIEAEKALRIWASLPLVSPFQSLALWPLISVLQDEKDQLAVIQYLKLLLHPSQHALSNELTAAMQNTIQFGEKEKWAEFRQELIRTVEQACLEKHL